MTNTDFYVLNKEKRRHVSVKTYRGKVLVHLRDFKEEQGVLKPTLKGIALSKEEYGNLVELLSTVMALAQQKEGKEIKFPLSEEKKRYITVTPYENRVLVHVRQYMEKGGCLQPTRTGIALTLDECQCLQPLLPFIDEAIKKKEEELSIKPRRKPNVSSEKSNMEKNDLEESTENPKRRWSYPPHEKQVKKIKVDGLVIDEVAQASQMWDDWKPLVFIYVSLLQIEISKLAHLFCDGCTMGYENQEEHECQMGSWKDNKHYWMFIYHSANPLTTISTPTTFSRRLSHLTMTSDTSSRMA